MAHLFDPDHLHQIAKGCVGLPHDQMMRRVIDELCAAYGDHIDPEVDWTFNLCGGAVAIMTVLHGSLSEYVLVYGSPIGVAGYSGRYRMEIWDFMLAGEMWTFTGDRSSERVVHRPGDVAYLAADQVKGFRLPEAGWMLEYGRGSIPLALPFALSDTLVSCLDLTTAWQLLRRYGKLVTRELLKGKI